MALRMGAADVALNSARWWASVRWGLGTAAAVHAAALRFGGRTAIVDDAGSVDYRTLDRAANSVAAEFRSAATGSDGNLGAIGILCRNHRWFVTALVAAERAGCDTVLLSTALPASNLAEVCERDSIAVIVADREFSDVVAQAGTDATVVSADSSGPNSLAHIAAKGLHCSPPKRRPRLVLLTSGTTGAPKSAMRALTTTRVGGVGMLRRIPYRLGDRYFIASPAFHAWGLSQLVFALATASTVEMRRRFDASDLLQLLREHQFDVLVVVPLMLRRILDVTASDDAARSPRMVLSSGNVLSGDLAGQWMDRFGDALYNIYGSTEAAIGTIADPADLRAAPGTVGRSPDGVTLVILDDEGMPAPKGSSGWVHLASTGQFDGYTDGTDRERTGTLMATGDIGQLDAAGRLHVSGRANDMIVTGGENVFPSSVEEVLDRHPAVEISAVVGTDDPEFGQRVAAFVVLRRGRSVDPDDLKGWVAAKLPSFMVPREVRFVDALPMTTTGKVVRHRLAVLGRRDRY
ncbi:AMP-binding protein [Candidatus Poriferisodalis sp.]|uniref:AMP-binding protein n=1 Tax=Candidatus Poriferisodalis sp. TaxID=3101277 RepID=UPI003D109E9A